ncbi:MAG: hypothetical protein J6Q85_08200 [Clostridia bacterium]|nr:hypothetical protein [Clostridia bacterium]
MKKFLLLTLILIMTTLVFTSCGDGSTAPDGMQLVYESKSEGYVFWGPDGWIISNRGAVAATYLSSFNQTSITFTKAPMPSETDGSGAVDFDLYFQNSMAAFPYEITVVERGVSENFGTAEAGADRAKRYVYTYKYGELDVACMQILLTRGEDFFIFTYTSYGSPSDESSYYRTYLDKALAVCENFQFTDKSDEGEAPIPSVDKDGYYLASNKTLSGFELYLPVDYTLVDASALVSAKISNKANVSLTRATQTGVGILDYLLLRREKLSAITDSFTDIKISVAKAVNTESEYFDDWTLSILPELDSELKLGNLDSSRVAAYEYTYTLGENTYHVLQVLGTDNLNGYVFTYTALEEEYAEHLGEIRTILEKVIF